ncbi:3-oxo-5-alpha-steroid 4-dehydrogenase [Dichotomocladium elegans]|nr:3-oxo-5-alpha-steroid 4-dehydrogenase [Dichotomocladium elegans]
MYLVSQVPDAAISQSQVILGSVIFFAAEASNHYHHLILAGLRAKKDDVRYRVPDDGLFKLVWCPHYLSEIVAFFSLGLVSQNVLGILFQLNAASYLSARALNTKAWYEQKFPEAPKRFALIPFIL